MRVSHCSRRSTASQATSQGLILPSTTWTGRCSRWCKLLWDGRLDPRRRVVNVRKSANGSPGNLLSVVRGCQASHGVGCYPKERVSGEKAKSCGYSSPRVCWRMVFLSGSVALLRDRPDCSTGSYPGINVPACVRGPKPGSGACTGQSLDDILSDPTWDADKGGCAGCRSCPGAVGPGVPGWRAVTRRSRPSTSMDPGSHREAAPDR